MSPAELKSARIALGLSPQQLAAMLRMRGEHARVTVHRWERGVQDIPGYVSVVLDLALNVPGVRERLGIGRRDAA